MLAKNAERTSVGMSAAYEEAAIYELLNRYCIQANDVISYLRC